MISREDSEHIERATEIMKDLYKETVGKDLTKEKIRKKFLENAEDPEKIAREFSMKTREVLAVLQEDLRRRRK